MHWRRTQYRATQLWLTVVTIRHCRTCSIWLAWSELVRDGRVLGVSKPMHKNLLHRCVARFVSDSWVYRATLCLSAVFAVTRTCPSVCPSRSCIVSRRLNYKPLSRPDTQLPGNPFNGCAKYTGVGKFCDFRLKSPFISETVRDWTIVAMEC